MRAAAVEIGCGCGKALIRRSAPPSLGQDRESQAARESRRPFEPFGDPKFDEVGTPRLKSAARFAQFISDDFAEILHAAARARIEACAIISI
jgi:hypothetical protein